ncbi:MAG TPA: protein translocase subunit SecD [Patescibacteria group bacterium]|nr:protein translocase subunit SecD [Patescibacteria group bacterium]
MSQAQKIPSKRSVRNRAIGLLVLFLVAASVSYPKPVNWIGQKLQSVIGVNLGQLNYPFHLGLDLTSGMRLEYSADLSKVAPADQTEALNGVKDVIERRVNTLGVSEPLVQTLKSGNDWRVNIELAGVSSTEAIKLIGETPILEFKEQNTDKAPPLTVDQQKQIAAQNADAKKRAEDILNQLKKPGTDFAAVASQKTEIAAEKASGGDVGFILDKPEYKDVYDAVKTLPASSTLLQVLDRPNSYAIAHVNEVKDAGVEVAAHHILISYQGAQGDFSSLTKAQALAKIQELKKEATPANFEQLAAQNSQEPGAVESKGDLGWFKKGDMVPEFEAVVFPQKVGTISDIVETPFGYHLIWKTGERPIKDVRVSLIELKKLTAEDLVPKPSEWKATNLTGKDLQSARVEFSQQTNAIEVALQFNAAGAKAFSDITARNVGKTLAIFLDGQIISAPRVSNQIDGGQAVITGNFSMDEAKTLARRLQAGALPVPVTLIAQQTVGPSLGADSLQKSLVAGFIGFLLVAIYMILLYRLPGIMSIVALSLYTVVLLALFKLIPVTLSLSGIAGFILSIGIAVDANVLVFERLKEEWHEGKGLTQALEDAFRRAWPSIRDGHMTVLISSLVLYWFSSSVIRGFALTLAIGTILSLFTAVVSCRTILRLVAGTSLGKFGWLFLKPRASEAEVQR